MHVSVSSVAHKWCKLSLLTSYFKIQLAYDNEIKAAAASPWNVTNATATAGDPNCDNHNSSISLQGGTGSRTEYLRLVLCTVPLFHARSSSSTAESELSHLLRKLHRSTQPRPQPRITIPAHTIGRAGTPPALQHILSTRHPPT